VAAFGIFVLIHALWKFCMRRMDKISEARGGNGMFVKGNGSKVGLEH
jgi:hypothetical protein